MKLLKRLWLNEPVIVRTVLSLAVSAGVLTLTQASAIGDTVAALATAVGLLSARGKVTPTPNHAPEHSKES